MGVHVVICVHTLGVRTFALEFIEYILFVLISHCSALPYIRRQGGWCCRWSQSSLHIGRSPNVRLNSRHHDKDVVLPDVD